MKKERVPRKKENFVKKIKFKHKKFRKNLINVKLFEKRKKSKKLIKRKKRKIPRKCQISKKVKKFQKREKFEKGRKYSKDKNIFNKTQKTKF